MDRCTCVHAKFEGGSRGRGGYGQGEWGRGRFGLTSGSGVLLTDQIQDFNILAKAVVLRINLNIDGAPIASRSHTHPSHSETFRLLTSSLSCLIFRCSSPPQNPVYARRVDPSTLAFCLSSHRHSYICFLFGSRFIV